MHRKSRRSPNRNRKPGLTSGRKVRLQVFLRVPSIPDSNQGLQRDVNGRNGSIVECLGSRSESYIDCFAAATFAIVG